MLRQLVGALPAPLAGGEQIARAQITVQLVVLSVHGWFLPHYLQPCHSVCALASGYRCKYTSHRKALYLLAAYPSGLSQDSSHMVWSAVAKGRTDRRRGGRQRRRQIWPRRQSSNRDGPYKDVGRDTRQNKQLSLPTPLASSPFLSAPPGGAIYPSLHLSYYYLTISLCTTPLYPCPLLPCCVSPLFSSHFLFLSPANPAAF